MKQFREMLLGNPKTSAGGFLCVAVVGLLVAHRITFENAVVLLGIAGGWLGFTGKDSDKGATKSNPVADHAIETVALAEKTGQLEPAPDAPKES